MAPTRPLLRLGVSRCLLGDEVRYDGGHRQEPFVTDRLGLLAEWEVVCPEYEAGLGVPREPIALAGDPSDPAVRGVETGIDHTRRLVDWGTKRLSEVDADRLDGFVLKSGSPSCALDPVPVQLEGIEEGLSPGLFVRALQRWDPSLPLTDELRLRQAEGQRAFFLRAFSRRFARALRPRLDEPGWANSPRWQEFFDAHRLALIARGQSPREVEDRCLGHAEAGRGLTELALSLAVDELPEGRDRAFASAVDWMSDLDRRHWLVLQPMLEEIRSGNMESEVLRITLQLMAQSVGSRRVADQLFLRPLWLGANGAPPTHSLPPAPASETASRRNTSP